MHTADADNVKPFICAHFFLTTIACLLTDTA